MSTHAKLTTVETVHEDGSWLFTVRDRFDAEEEVLLVPCEDGVEAWVNQCTHEAQRFDTGRGAPIRDGEIICPKHGSLFDTCSGHCDNGKAADTTLPSVEVDVDDGDVYLADSEYEFVHAGGIEEDDEGPSSTSHLSF